MAFTEFRVGMNYLGIDFGNVQNGFTSDTIDTFLHGLEYEESMHTLLSGEIGENIEYAVMAVYAGEGAHVLIAGNDDDVKVLYCDIDDDDFGDKGWKNLTNGKYMFPIAFSVSNVNDISPAVWNGVLFGAYNGDEPTPPTPGNEGGPYIGYCLLPRIPSDKMVKVLVPEGGLYAGQLVNCVELANPIDTIGNNLEVYVATKPTTATLDSEFIAIVQNSQFETLEDGRRPDGQPNYTKYKYKEGDIADAILLDKNLIFEVGCTVVTGGDSTNYASDIGKFIVPVNDSYNGKVDSTPTNGGCLQIINTNYFRCGGQFGADFKPTYIARAYR